MKRFPELVSQEDLERRPPPLGAVVVVVLFACLTSVTVASAIYWQVFDSMNETRLENEQ